jgi:aspartate beta-hydroxylase
MRGNDQDSCQDMYGAMETQVGAILSCLIFVGAYKILADTDTHHTIQQPLLPITESQYSGFHCDCPGWCGQLEKNFHTILEEYESIRRSALGWSKVGNGDRGSGTTDHRVVAGQDWSEYVLFGTGQQNSPNTMKTQSLIRQIIPDAVSLAEQGGGEVIFSRLAPRTHIQPHCGPTNLRWTAHLGLVVPKHSAKEGFRCQIRVGERWHSWELGKILLFDDSFEHEVRNDTEEERVVLLLRLWHPGLPRDCRSGALLEARQSKDDAVTKRYHPPKP